MSISTLFDTQSTLVGPGDLISGSQANDPVREADPEKEYVAFPSEKAHLGVEPFSSYGAFFRRQQLHVLRSMPLAPAIGSSLSALCAGTLSGGFVLTPAVRDKAPTEDDADAEEAQRAVEECLHSAFRLEQPLEVWAWEMLHSAFVEGHKLSETVMEVLGEGPYAGTYGLKALKTKPRWSYRFRVDGAMNVEAIDCYTVRDKWESIDPSHFAWLTWDIRDGDPRGRSILDSVFHAFNLLMQLWPEFYQGNIKFGSPSLFITTSVLAKQMVPPRDAQGQEIPGKKPVTAEFAAAKMGDRMKGGATVAMPQGSTATVIESQRDGLGMNNAIALLEAQIVKAILLQVRATMESKHGSRADSETGQDVLGTLLRFVRTLTCQPARKVFHSLLAANHGEAYACRFTPHVGLGRIEPQDFVAFATAIGVLYQAGYLTETQLPEMDAFLNIPQRRQGEERVGPQKDVAAMKPAEPAPAPEPKGAPR
jgi:hypothetical protein